MRRSLALETLRFRETRVFVLRLFWDPLSSNKASEIVAKVKACKKKKERKGKKKELEHARICGRSVLSTRQTTMRWHQLVAAASSVTAVCVAGSPIVEESPSSASASAPDAVVPVAQLSAPQVQSLLANWGLEAIGAHFGNADGHQLSLLGADDLDFFLQGARDVGQRLAVKSLLVKLEDAKTQGGVSATAVRAPTLRQEEEDEEEEEVEGAASEFAARVRSLQQASGDPTVEIDLASGEITWDSLSLDGYSGVNMRSNSSLVVFGDSMGGGGGSQGGGGGGPTTIFRAGPGWLGVQGGLSVQGNVTAPNLASLVDSVRELVEWKRDMSATVAAFSDLVVTGNVTVGEHLNWDYKQTHLQRIWTKSMSWKTRYVK